MKEGMSKTEPGKSSEFSNQKEGTSKTFEKTVLEAETSNFKSIEDYLEDRKFHDETYLVSKPIGITWDGMREKLEDLYQNTAMNPSQSISDGKADRPDHFQNSLIGAAIGSTTGIFAANNLFLPSAFSTVAGMGLGCAVGGASGYLASRSQHDSIIESRENQSHYELFNENNIIEEAIEESPIVKVDRYEGTNRSDIEDEWLKPETASKMYNDAINIFENKEEFWREETEEIVSPKEVKKLVDLYGEEAKDLELLDGEEVEYVKSALQEENLEQPREESEITTLIRYQEAEPSEIDTAYQIEVYQGEEKRMQMRGLHNGSFPDGENLRYTMERELKEKLVGIDKTVLSRMRNL